MGVNGVEYFAHPWECGARKAKELLFTGDWVTAEEAHRLGMVNHVVARDDLRPFVMAMAGRDRAAADFRPEAGEGERQPDARGTGSVDGAAVGVLDPAPRPRPQPHPLRHPGRSGSEAAGQGRRSRGGGDRASTPPAKRLGRPKDVARPRRTSGCCTVARQAFARDGFDATTNRSHRRCGRHHDRGDLPLLRLEGRPLRRGVRRGPDVSSTAPSRRRSRRTTRCSPLRGGARHRRWR